MAATVEEIATLVRQLRVELDWARRTGVKLIPPVPLAPVESRQSASPPAGRAPQPSQKGPPERHEAPFEGEISPKAPEHAWRSEPEAPPKWEGPPPPIRKAPPDAPWEAHLPEEESLTAWASGLLSKGKRRDPGQTSNAPASRPSPTSRPPPAAPPASRQAPTPRQTSPVYAPSPADLSYARLLDQLQPAEDLKRVHTVLGDCRRCKLAGMGRRHVVFGVGSPDAELMFVGEAPGAEEDRQGEPFVGEAGQLLTKMIEAGMGYRRSEVYIANIIKCRPPDNRDPEPDEIVACEPFLVAQIQQIRPQVIITLGRYAAQTLLRSQLPISRLRGRWAKYAGIPVMPTYHPAYLLRRPGEKGVVWQDLKAVMVKLGRLPPQNRR